MSPTNEGLPPHSTREVLMPVAMFLVDESGVIEHAEPGVRGVLGVEPGACRGERLDTLLPRPGIVEALRQVIEGKAERQTLELHLGDQRLGVAVAQAGAGRVSVLLVASNEGTSLGAARVRSTIESVVSGFAHEVRNPIAAILSLTEAAITQLGAGAPTAMLERIPGLVTRVDKLIKQSLRYSRPRPPNRSPEPLPLLVDWAVELARMKTSSLTLSVDVGEHLGDVLVDAEQVEQVLVNLLCNARDAARSRVVLTARLTGNPEGKAGVVIEVSDDGGGVEEGLRARIFEPFFTTKAHGTGLGLAIARDLARLNGGDLVLFSSSGAGSTFHTYLELAGAPCKGPARGS